MSEKLENLRKRFQRWRSELEIKGLKVNIRQTNMNVSGTEREIALSKIDPCGMCEKKLCLMRCGAHCVKSGFMRDAPKRQRYCSSAKQFVCRGC